MAQKTTEEGVTALVSQKQRDFESCLAGIRDEIARLEREVGQVDIPNQRASRKARIAVLQEEQKQTETAMANLARAERLWREFDPITPSRDWFVGYVESPKGKIMQKKFMCLVVLCFVSPLAFGMIYVGGFWGGFLGGMIGMLATIILIQALSTGAHAVFKGVIPVSVLETYQSFVAAKTFDHIVVAAPDQTAFTQMGVRTDPVMVGVIGKKVRFTENGQARVAYSGLLDPNVFLFEIARWDTAGDLKHLKKSAAI